MQGFKILTALCAFVSLASAFDGKLGLPKPQKKNVCLNKEDGDLLPVAGSCSKFIVCFNGLPVEQTCGKYHFNAKILICDLPERVGCSSFKPLTTLAPFKSVEDKDVIIPSPTLPPCFAVANGISLPVPGNQRQYYFCMNNKAYLKDCGNMYFDPKYSACAVKPGSFDSSVIVSPTKAPSNQQSVCFGKPNGSSLPVPGNPHQFYFCQNNKAFLKVCGHKMVFVPKYSACALESDEAYEPAEELDQTNHFQEVARKVCKNKPFGTRLSFPGHCSLYVICTFNYGFVKTCGWREFNSRSASCDLPENVKCQAHNQKTTAKQQEFKPTQKPTTSPLADRICLKENDGVFKAAPGVCSDFFFCMKGKGYRKSCGEERHFNPKSMICVDIKYSKCVDIISTKKSQRSISPRADSTCVNKENGTLLTSSNSCGKFNICDNGNAVEMDCPAGLYFNANDNVCDYPTNVQCSI